MISVTLQRLEDQIIPEDQRIMYSALAETGSQPTIYGPSIIDASEGFERGRSLRLRISVG